MMLAHYAARRNIIYAVNIIAEGNITCPQGQTSFGDLLYRRPPLTFLAFCAIMSEYSLNRPGTRADKFF